MNKILVTGATGFVGHALVKLLAEQTDNCIVAAVRHRSNGLPDSIKQMESLALTPDTNWNKALENVTCVIHLAGVTTPRESDTDNIYRINTEGTLNLATQAASAGVRRFIFISSIKVNGEQTAVGQPFTHDQKPAPEDTYGQSKLTAEQGLHRLKQSNGHSMDIVIIRPPLVYGPGVKANFRRMLAWTQKGLPLPLGAIHNQRSFVALDNLTDLITTCIDHPNAGNNVFLVSDGADLSTPALLRLMGRALNRPARLLPLPPRGLTTIAVLLGQRRTVQRLCGNLQVDMAHTCNTLNWTPPVSVEAALQQTIDDFQASLANSVQAPAMPNGRLLRFFDVALSLTGLIAGSPLLAGLLIGGWLDTRAPLFYQQRVGRHQKPFTLVKFRTMRRGTPSTATHLADASAVTRLGRFMRKTKLDELPQLWNVLRGDMSLVGPRPGLVTQKSLTAERAKRGVFCMRPGITGLAQISHIDMSTPQLLAQTDSQMLQSLTVRRYFSYIFKTVTGRGKGDGLHSS